MILVFVFLLVLLRQRLLSLEVKPQPTSSLLCIQAGLKFEILLPLPLKCWDCRHDSVVSAPVNLLKVQIHESPHQGLWYNDGLV